MISSLTSRTSLATSLGSGLFKVLNTDSAGSDSREHHPPTPPSAGGPSTLREGGLTPTADPATKRKRKSRFSDSNEQPQQIGYSLCFDGMMWFVFCSV